MKKLLLFFVLLVFCASVCAETLDDTSYIKRGMASKQFTPQNFPVLYKYCDDYAKMLYYKFDPKIYPYVRLAQGDAYFVKSNGQIIFLTNDPSLMTKRSYMFRKFILDNPPPPFPKEIEDKVIAFETYFGIDKKDDNDDRIKIIPFENPAINNNPAISIGCEKSIKYKNMTQIKCERMGHKWDSEGGYCITPYTNK